MKRKLFKTLTGFGMMLITAVLFRFFEIWMSWQYNQSIGERMNADVPLNETYQTLETVGFAGFLVLMVIGLAMTLNGLTELVMEWRKERNPAASEGESHE